MRLGVFSVLAMLAAWVLLPVVLPAAEQADPAVQQRQLDLAELFERIHDWGKAEAQLMEAAQGPSEELRKRALEGIERVRKLAESSDGSSSLKLGGFYERREMWSEAEKHYLAAAQGDSEEVQGVALKGLKRVRDQMPWSRLAEDLRPRFDILSGLISRGLAVIGALAILLLLGMAIRGVLEIRRQIEVLPFVASNEATGAQLTYWLSHSQAMVQTAGALPSPAGTTSVLPYLQLPGLAEKLPELGDIPIGGVKLPAGELLQRLGRPRVRISGGWITNDPHGWAFAEFKRRRGLSRYESYAIIKRDIPATRLDQELELFAYHILIKAAETYVS